MLIGRLPAPENRAPSARLPSPISSASWICSRARLPRQPSRQTKYSDSRSFYRVLEEPPKMTERRIWIISGTRLLRNELNKPVNIEYLHYLPSRLPFDQVALPWAMNQLPTGKDLSSTSDSNRNGCA